MKNVKKFVLKERPVLAAVHYHAGHAYASNMYSLVWVEDNSMREGAFDAESGAPVKDVKMPTPSFDKVIPKVNEDSAYATVGNTELAQMLSVLKTVDACAPNRKDSDAVMLVWRPSGLTMYACGETLRAEYCLSGKTLNLTGDSVYFAVFNAKLLSVLIDYLRQRKGAARFYASRRIISPLRIDMAPPYAVASGVVIAPQHTIKVERWTDVIPAEMLRVANKDAEAR